MALFVLGALLIIGLFSWTVRQAQAALSWIWLFLIGGLLGATWEIGFTLFDMAHQIEPGGRPLPEGEGWSFEGPLILALVALLVFCVWDAGLFLAGAFVARRVLRREIFIRFSWPELIILLAWGQAQSIVVEMLAISAGWWGYKATVYNPQLFPYQNGSITLWPQLVWVLAYFVFYGAALLISRSQEQRPSVHGASHADN
ncbi:MAG: hypothetical protein AAF225_12520 [Pseudomonadota bacterium]